MQYSALLLSAIAVTGALAAPASHNAKPLPPSGLRLKLDGQPSVQFTVAQFDSDKTITHKFKHQGPFKAVTLELGSKVKNQDVRCQVVDDQEPAKPIIMTRGENVDINFSKGKPWTFKKESKVTTVKCGPEFLKTDQETVNKITVTLKNAGNDGSIVTQELSVTDFDEKTLPQTQEPQGTAPQKTFDTVQLKVGLNIENQALRCKVLGKENNEIIVKRGENIDFSFADGLNPNPWTFAEGASEVSNIVCDPAFKKADARGALNKPKMPVDDAKPATDNAVVEEDESEMA